MKERFRSARDVVEETYGAWRADRTIRLGAGIAYYALFGVVPFLALAMWLAGLVFSQDAIQRELVENLSQVFGVEQADAFAAAVSRELAEGSYGGSLGLIGLGSLVFASSLLFAALQDALNVIFGIPVEVGIRHSVRRRIALFGLVLVFGSAILLSLVLDSVLAFVEGLFSTDVPSIVGDALEISGRVLSIGVLIGGLALLYRLLPRVEVSWRAALIGALAAVLVGGIASSLVGLYLGRFGTSSLQGAAGGVLLMLTLVYALSQIVLAAAQLVKVLGRRAESEDHGPSTDGPDAADAG